MFRFRLTVRFDDGEVETVDYDAAGLYVTLMRLQASPIHQTLDIRVEAL